MATLELILVRHAQSEWNAAGRWQGHADPPLSPEGLAQAEALAETLPAHGISRLIASDLQRARQTAAPWADRLGCRVELAPALRELDVGRWAGLTREEIERSEPELLREFESGDPTVRPGGGETRAELRARVRAFVSALAGEPRVRDETIGIVAHLGVLRGLVPGCTPANGEAIRIGARAALALRARELPSELSH